LSAKADLIEFKVCPTLAMLERCFVTGLLFDRLQTDLTLSKGGCPRRRFAEKMYFKNSMTFPLRSGRTGVNKRSKRGLCRVKFGEANSPSAAHLWWAKRISWKSA
jgi:hypothetical protein